MAERTRVENPFTMGPSVGRPQHQPDLQSRVPSRGSFDKAPSPGTYIADALIKFAGVAGGEYVKRTAKKVEADKILQTARAQRHKAPTEGATHAGYVAHAAVALQGQVIKQQAGLNALANTNVTDGEWDLAISKAYSDVDDHMVDNYVNYATDKDFQKLGAVAMREMVPQAESARAAAQIGFELEGRLKVSTDLIVDAASLGTTAGTEPQVLAAQITGMVSSMQFTASQKDDVLLNAILTTEDPNLLAVAKSYKGDRSTSLFQRSTKLKTLERKLISKAQIDNAMDFAVGRAALEKAALGPDKTVGRDEVIRRAKTTKGLMSPSQLESILNRIDAEDAATTKATVKESKKLAAAEKKRFEEVAFGGMREDIMFKLKSDPNYTVGMADAEMNRLNEVFDYRFANATQMRAIHEEARKGAENRTIIDGGIDALTNMNATYIPGTPAQQQQAITRAINIKSESITKEAEKLPAGKDRDEALANASANVTKFAMDRTTELNVPYKPIVDGLRNLSFIGIATKEVDGKLEMTDSALQMTKVMSSMSPESKSFYFDKSIADVRTSRVIKAYDFFVNERKLDPIAALERSRAFRFAPTQTTVEVKEATAAVQEDMRSWYREDTNDAQKEWLDGVVWRACSSEAFANSKTGRASVTGYMKGQFTVMEDGTWIKGQTKPLSLAAKIPISLFDDAVVRYKEEMSVLLKERLGNQTLTMDDVFLVTDMDKGTIHLATKTTVLVGTGNPISELGAMYYRKRDEDKRLGKIELEADNLNF